MIKMTTLFNINEEFLNQKAPKVGRNDRKLYQGWRLSMFLEIFSAENDDFNKLNEEFSNKKAQKETKSSKL